MNAVAITDVLDKGGAQFRRALPEHIPVERFKRVAQTAILNSPILMRADPRALLTELVKAAQDGLLPDGREAAIVPTGAGVSYRPMVAGILKKARNSGEIAGISCEVAYKGEKFSVVLGDEPKITHERDLEAADDAPWVAVYAVATLKSGEKVRAVMTRAQVFRIRDRSDAYRAWKAGKIKSTPWDTDPEEMAKKTVIKRLAKLLPSSTDKDEALRRTIEREDDEHTLEASVEPEVAVQPPTDRMAALEAAVVAEDGGPPDDGWPGPDVPAAPAAPVLQNVSQEELKALAQDPAPVRGPGR
jgi:recombination protein RecT